MIKIIAGRPWNRFLVESVKKIVNLRGGRACKRCKNQPGFVRQSQRQVGDETFGSSELLGFKILWKLGRKLQFRRKSLTFR